MPHMGLGHQIVVSELVTRLCVARAKVNFCDHQVVIDMSKPMPRKNNPLTLASNLCMGDHRPSENLLQASALCSLVGILAGRIPIAVLRAFEYLSNVSAQFPI